MVRSCSFLILSFLLFQTSCKKSPTEPDFKSPREYTWTATQLQYPGAYNLTMYSVWGGSPTDVYVCGFSILSGQKGAMFRYDGRQWSPVVLPSPDYNELSEITGFAANDVWVAGARLYTKSGGGSLDSAVILRYNGTRWTQMLPTHMGVRGLKSIGGNSSQNLFFGSLDGKVIRYNGTTWNVDTLYLGLSVEAVGGDDARVFALGTTWKGALDDSVMCFTRTSGRWTLFDMQYVTQWLGSSRFGLPCVYSPAAGVIYSTGDLSIFRWEGEKWIKVFSPFASVLGMSGSPASLLAVGWNGKPLVYHWDGRSWDEIKLPEGLLPAEVLLYGVWTNGREAFVVGNNGAVSYVLHGK